MPSLQDALEQNEWTVFKGGSAFNGYLTAFQGQFPRSAYIIPITDDGGSSREIGRVFGGPAIGDLRATLTRLSDQSTLEASAVKKLLEHRLSNDDPQAAEAEWHALLEDRHPLYSNITSKYKNFIRSFLCKFEAERLYRIDSHFDLRNGSIGNFFFSGARMVLGSLETHVLPIIDSNDRLGIGVKLENGKTIIGQTMISHPCGSSLAVDKNSTEPLPAPITELFYIDKYHNRISPDVNPEAINSIKESRGLIYGVGSFWTSIAPSLILNNVGEAIAELNSPKIAIVNCCHDRETAGMTILDYVNSLTRSLNRYGALSYPPKAYVTDLFTVKESEFAIDEESIRSLGITLHYIPTDALEQFNVQKKAYPVYSTQALLESIKQIEAKKKRK
jgi:2-phospho-L-lactate transferase/gluconeogenesis factor (CofD/UPF0052 family)